MHTHLINKFFALSALAFTILVRPISLPRFLMEDSAQEYYVANDGDNDNPGTIDEPWRTIQKAADTMVAGDIAYVRGGTYTGVSLTRSGLPDEYITYKAYPGENPIVVGQGEAGFEDRYVQTSSLEYFIIDGFEIRNFDHGIALTHSNHFIIRNNTIHHNVKMGIKVDDSQFGEIAYNVISRSGSYSGIWVIGSRNVDIHHNIAYSNNHNGIAISYDSDGVTIHHNVAYDNSCGEDQRYAGIAIEVDSENNKVYNNLVYNNCHAGYITNSSNNEIYHNVFYGNTTAQISNGDWLGSYPIRNTYKNNIIVITRSGDRGITFWGSGYNPLDNLLDNNLYFYVDGPDKSDMVRTGSREYTFSEWKESGKEQNGVLGNPEFVNPGQANFHLLSNSIAIDAGVNVGIQDDFDGENRPKGVAPDIGAYEFEGEKTTSTPPFTATPIPVTSTTEPTSLTFPATITAQPKSTSEMDLVEPSLTQPPIAHSTPGSPIETEVGIDDRSTSTAAGYQEQDAHAHKRGNASNDDEQRSGLSITELREYIIEGVLWLADLIKFVVGQIIQLFTSS
jgi:parallel beta-helix repeat protein